MPNVQIAGFNYEVSEERQRQLEDVGEFLAPGFFTPYRSPGDVATAVTAPITFPLVGAVLTGIFGVVGLFAIPAAILSFAAAGCADLAGNQEVRDNALLAGVVTGILAIAAPLLAILTAIVSVVTFASAVVALVTRPVATLVSAVAECCSPQEEGMALHA